MEKKMTFPANHLWVINLSVVLFFAFPYLTRSAGLSVGFYGVSCPAAEIIVKNTVRSASAQDPTVPGKLLRLLFHDCFIEVSTNLNIHNQLNYVYIYIYI